MEEGSSSSSSSPSPSTIPPSGSSPAIDRHNPIIRDSTRTLKSLSRPPISLKALKVKEKKEKSEHEDLPVKSDDISLAEDLDDEKIEKSTTKNDGKGKANTFEPKIYSSTEAYNFVSPPVSRRYSIKQDSFLNPVTYLEEASDFKNEKIDELSDEKQTSSSLEQVVVVRVSLHCRGCERKMRKHLSKMEGVSSFIIDFAAKKVSITGRITPLSVLTSMSKVKNAHLSIQEISTMEQPGVGVGAGAGAGAGKGTCGFK